MEHDPDCQSEIEDRADNRLVVHDTALAVGSCQKAIVQPGRRLANRTVKVVRIGTRTCRRLTSSPCTWGTVRRWLCLLRHVIARRLAVRQRPGREARK